MEQKYRNQFNSNFTKQKYKNFINDFSTDFDYEVSSRIAETPFFIDNKLKMQLIEATSEVIDFIKKSDFKLLTEKALLLNKTIPNEDDNTTFLEIDFGICEENHEIIPKLIEVQGFPSLFNFQYHLAQKFKKQYPFLSELTPFFNDLSEADYLNILEQAICNNHSKENVILLEIEPEKQNTQIDFLYCNQDIGIPIICVTKVFKEGNQLFYKNNEGKVILIKRIYNRVIFDELDLRNDLKLHFDFLESYDVEWAGHPNWFFRISKFILPYLNGKYFIETTLLSDLQEIPIDLENYVLKPLFSFSGSGVVFNVTANHIAAITEKELYVLQKKVFYKPIVQAPDELVKAEVRILSIWKKNEPSPTLATNLVRLSKGEIIGVKFNKDKDWVGGTIGLFEK